MSEDDTPNRRVKPRLTDKQKLEGAVGAIGKAIADSIKVVEQSSELTQEQVTTAFQFISHLLLTGGQKALLSLSIAKAANGGFSLDEPPAMQPVPGFALAGVERIAVANQAPHGGLPKRIPSQDDDVDFLDEDGPGFN